MFNRRTFVGATGAFVTVGGTKAFGAGSPKKLQVKIALSSGEHVFNSGTGKDLGDYKGPNFIQRNILVRDRTIPFTVIFRPDVTSNRIEVVFEWGDPFWPKGFILDAYTAEILSNGETIAKIDVPQHFWLSRWRWQSEPRPFIKTPEDIFRENILPRFRRMSPRQALPRRAPDYSVMEFSNVTAYMPTTGGRMDIGLVPEYYAAYLATGDADMKASMMAWAESAGSFPWHMRDSKTWAPINWNTYPNSTTYYDQSSSSPKLTLTTDPPPRNLKGQTIAIDTAHEPALSFLPFMLTGDLYYLEELQFMAGYLVNSTPSWRGLFSHGQTRGWAWSLRTMSDVLCATPENVSGGLLPKDYWKGVLTRNLNDILTTHVHAKDTKDVVFASGTDARRMPFWQEDYLAAALGVAVHRGFEEWRPVFEWKIQSNIARTNGTSGWPRTFPTLYYPKLAFTSVSVGKNVGNGTLTVDKVDFVVEQGLWTVRFLDAKIFEVLRPDGKLDGRGKVGSTYSEDAQNSFEIRVAPGSMPFASGDSFVISLKLAKSWEELAAINDVHETANGKLDPKLSREYPQPLLTGLVLGVINGVTAARPCLEWYEPEILALHPPDWRWSIVKDA